MGNNCCDNKIMLFYYINIKKITKSVIKTQKTIEIIDKL